MSIINGMRVLALMKEFTLWASMPFAGFLAAVGLVFASILSSRGEMGVVLRS